MRVLFVCTGNTCRSPLAEALARSLEPALIVSSAGLGAREGDPATPEAVETARLRGLDLSTHRARGLSPELVEQSDLILVMTGSHRRALLQRFPSAEGKVALLKAYADGAEEGDDVDDPFGGSPSVYEACAAELEHELLKARRHWASRISVP